MVVAATTAPRWSSLLLPVLLEPLLATEEFVLLLFAGSVNRLITELSDERDNREIVADLLLFDADAKCRWFGIGSSDLNLLTCYRGCNF